MRTFSVRRVLALGLILLALRPANPASAVGNAQAGPAAPFTIVGWNVESGGAQLDVVAERISALQDIDMWGLSEVPQADAQGIFEAAAEVGEDANFESILGTSGGDDRLLILYDADRFEQLGIEELEDINIGGNVRAPLVAHFRDLTNQQEFLFMVNHLYRSRAERRHEQSRLLNQWAQEQELPVIAVGDYNYDWEVDGGQDNHDLGYDLLTAGGLVKWVRPAVLVNTQCTVGGGPVCRFDTVLDFVFTAGPAMKWPATSEIMVVEGDFPDDDTTSDHRPVLATFQVPEVPSSDMLKQELLERITRLEAELAALKGLVEQIQ